MKIAKISINANSNIGMYIYTNDNITITNIKSDVFKKVLKTKIINTRIYDSELCGAFVAGNNKSLVMPDIVDKKEIAKVEKHIPVGTIKTKFTALGNLIVANDTHALISEVLEKNKDEIKKILQVEKIKVFKPMIGEIVGSLIRVNKNAIYASEKLTENELKEIQKFFNLPITAGTVNLGSPYVSAGIVVNKNGVLIGETTGGPEANYIYNAFFEEN